MDYGDDYGNGLVVGTAGYSPFLSGGPGTVAGDGADDASGGRSSWLSMVGEDAPCPVCGFRLASPVAAGEYVRVGLAGDGSGSVVVEWGESHVPCLEELDYGGSVLWWGEVREVMGAVRGVSGCGSSDLLVGGPESHLHAVIAPGPVDGRPFRPDPTEYADALRAALASG